LGHGGKGAAWWACAHRAVWSLGCQGGGREEGCRILEFGGSTLCLDQSANDHPSGCEICRLDGGRAGLE
ncbi:unnamed protein product, partial [Symbiodinium necroappetens]